jgi:hypothetical protein
MKKHLLCLAICFFSLPLLDSASAQDRKMTAEELVVRHLESIGQTEARARAASRVASGKTSLIIRIGGASNLEGQAMIVSTGTKLRFGMKFAQPDYPGEDMAFDGNKSATGILPQGRRTGLSAFLNSQNLPLKEGLMCGALSTAWPLLRVEQTQPRLDYKGLKKIDGRQLHELSYRPRKGGSDLNVLIYLDPETFRHVRTKYSFVISASIGTREAPNSNPESHYAFTEDFDDFRVIDGLTLPHKYRLQYSSEGRMGSSLQDWTVVIDRVSHNTTLDNQLFSIR